MRCKTCDKETTNSKFCSRSCAAILNNSLTPKRNKTLDACSNCGKPCKRISANKNNYCDASCLKNSRLTQILRANRFDVKGCPSSKTVRKYLQKLNGNNCAVCKQSATNWCGAPLTLIVDHIDGDAHNWTLTNVRLVCPNCDSQLPTFKGRNKGKSTRKYTITQK